MDGGAFGGGRDAIDQPLIPRRQFAAADANRMKFVDLLGNSQKMGDRPEGLAAEIHVGARQDDPHTAVGQVIHDRHDSQVEELGLVDGDHVDAGPNPLRDLHRRRNRSSFQAGPRVGADLKASPVAIIEVGLEDLNVPSCDERTADSPHEFFRLAREHHAGDYLDPPPLLA